ATAVLVLAACGTAAPDLFVVQRSGSVPGADLRLLVSDASVRCNGGPPRQLSSEEVLEARTLADDLRELQTSGRRPPAARAQIFSFAVRTEEGTLRFADTAARPDVLPRVTRFTRRAATDLCGLRR
ncbi:MAG: hypothetical protein H0T43_01060, partial [Solirubrobacterales bacterium]|nr:hypothetical protein [Solirubrobacterales bacterium]